MDVSHDFEYSSDSRTEKYDGEFLNVAKKIINDTIVRAMEKIVKTDFALANSCPGCEGIKPQDDPEDNWPIPEKMSVRAGLRCVKKMMKEWKSETAMRGWKFYAEFIGLENDGSSDFYIYQVRWSIVTPAYPEPQVTVSVFITVEATNTKYPNCPVDVTYVFEGNQFAHRLKMQFRPKWIYDVLDIKTMMFKSIEF